MPRDPVRTFTFAKTSEPKKKGLLVPGIGTDRAPSSNFGRVRRFWLHLSSEFIDVDPNKMSLEELEVKSKFPLPMTLAMTVNHQGVPNVTEAEEWADLGLALRWDQEATHSQHSLRIHLADSTKPVAKQLSRAVMRIDAHRMGLVHKLRERARLQEKILTRISSLRGEMMEAGVALVLLPQLIGCEELAVNPVVPMLVEEADAPTLFRSKKLPPCPTLDLKVRQ